MKVSLVAVTQSHIPRITTAEDLIVYAARVSNPDNQLNTETGGNLIRYCMKHGHWSVFETASMTLEIKTSRAIAAQIIRHRSFTIQEFSQRYAEVSDFEPVELRKQAEKNRQSSTSKVTDAGLESIAKWALDAAKNCYTDLINNGVARECARMILPLCTQTTLYMTGNVRSWIHYFQQRLSDHTQKEHREVAEAAYEIFKKQFPIITNAINGTTQETGQPAGGV
jgi:thymidylate synthase (FAD)